MKNPKRILLLASIPIVLGWALFRPDLLFVDQKVNEKFPEADSVFSMTLAMGEFSSLAHETRGKATIVNVEGKKYLRLQDFKTSNGPDVHIYLFKTQGSDFLDLGSIKGNVGDQNYELPAGTNVANFRAVSVWCKRFEVNFGEAPLALTKTSAQADGAALLASYQPDIIVTHGNFKGDLRGKAELVENSGKRFVRISGPKLGANMDLRVLLLKAESPKSTADVMKAARIDLGMAKSGTAQFPIGDSVDAWLYRSVSLWDAKVGKSLGIAHLRSDQEKPQTRGTA